jgi:hypothetical protein
MIKEGKLLKMIHRVLHDSLLASATGHSTPTSDNSTAISWSTTDTVDYCDHNERPTTIQTLIRVKVTRSYKAAKDI